MATASSTAISVPHTLGTDLIERLALLAGQPEGVPEVALSAVPYGSMISLIAHGIIEPPEENPEPDDAFEVVLTRHGREIINSCAQLRSPDEQASRPPRVSSVGVPISADDAAFLDEEGMEIGAVATFDGPIPNFGDALEYVRGRLDHFPRYRQKLVAPRIGRQRWVCDPHFNLDYHVRYAAIPPPGGTAELEALTARIFSQFLDRSKPLWEVWLVAGLANGRFAVISKAHLALIDGVSGFDLMTMLFDVSSKPVSTLADLPWEPEPPVEVASSGALLAATIKEDATRLARVLPVLPGRIASAVDNPRAAATRAQRVMEAAARRVWTLLRPPPRSPLNASFSPHRRMALVDADLEDFKKVKDAFGATIDDVVVAVIAGALRSWLAARDMPADDYVLTAAVPVCSQAALLGDGIANMLAPLPVDQADAFKRLERTHFALGDVRRSRSQWSPDGMGAVYPAQPKIVAHTSRMRVSPALYDLLIANVPGPPLPLFFGQRRMASIYPVPPLTGERAVAVAVMAYNDQLHFSVVGDYRVLEDIDIVAEGVTSALRELVELGTSSPKPISVVTGLDPESADQESGVDSSAEAPSYFLRT
jgi:WS/DGAT/MGAT family acyltransferase